MYFEIYKESTGIGAGLLAGVKAPGQQWRWRLRAGNNEIIANGEGYNNRQDCLHAVNLLKSTDATTPVKET